MQVVLYSIIWKWLDFAFYITQLYILIITIEEKYYCILMFFKSKIRDIYLIFYVLIPEWFSKLKIKTIKDGKNVYIEKERIMHPIDGRKNRTIREIEIYIYRMAKHINRIIGIYVIILRWITTWLKYFLRNINENYIKLYLLACNRYK